MKFKAGQFIVIKDFGAAKVDEVLGDDYFVFFANGKRGGGWKDRDVTGTVTEKQFWAEWRRNRAFN